MFKKNLKKLNYKKLKKNLMKKLKNLKKLFTKGFVFYKQELKTWKKKMKLRMKELHTLKKITSLKAKS